MAIDKNRVGRTSSQILGQYGSQRKSVPLDGSIVNSYKYAQGGEKFYSPENLSLGYGNLVSGSVDAKVFDVYYSYFEKINKSRSLSESMALLLLDAVKLQKLDPYKTLDKLKSSNKVSLPQEFYAWVNLLRAKSNQHEYTSKVNNKKSNIARNILI